MNGKIEILGGNGIENAFKELCVEATRTHQRVLPKEDGVYHGEAYEVWELSQDEYTKIRDISDDEWKDYWGFWRWAEGSNLIGEPTHQFTINNQNILAWFSQEKLDEHFESFLEPDYIEQFDNKDEAKAKLEKDYWNEDCNYKDFYQYCSEEWGVSTERNVCAVAIELARLNNMTMGELLNKIG